MAAKPCGSLVVSPPLREEQVDSLLQRQDFYFEHQLRIVKQYLPEDLAMELFVKLVAGWNYAQFPEHFGGDETRLLARAAKLRDDEGGLRSMPNGYRPPNPEADANAICNSFGEPKRKKGLKS